MTVVMETEDPIVQAKMALNALKKAIVNLGAQLLTSSHAGKDKRTLETTMRVANSAYETLNEMFKQMQGVGWDKSIVEKDWFEDPNSSEGFYVFKSLFEDTKANLEKALDYSINVNLSGRFLRIGVSTKETIEDAAPSKPVAYGLIALIAIAVIAIVVLR